MSTDEYDYEAALRQIDAWAEMAERQAAQAQAVARRVDELRITAWSPAREVRVDVTPSGMVSDIDLSDRALALSSDRLAGLVLTTYRRALAKLQGAIEEAGAETIGSDQKMLSSMTSTYRQAFEPHIRKLGPDADISWS